ncbi:MAG: protein phosphatase 2C domain-containing protein [Oscillospiraceae bacterium]|nr:protein phosphatase 2C domain-containing protein [Oscillospiraceae bacterium]
MNIIAITQKGPNKAENEDRIILGKNIIAEGIFQTQLVNGIIAVADGVGGNNAGAVASHFVAKQLSTLNTLSENELTRINEELLSLSSECSDYENMATTLSGVASYNGITQLFSIGNTRVYLLQGRKYLKQLTTDDTTLNYLLATGQLSSEEAESFDRKNEITACFGGGAAHLFKIKCSTMELLPSPFIITSDGIHDYISIDLMEDIIAAKGITVSACEAMITAARNAESKDDISIVMGEIVNLSNVKFDYIDPSDMLTQFKHNINYNDRSGFAPVANLE